MDEDIQSLFFERIKQKLNSNLSLVNEVAEVLGVSNDSVYRRLRGETALTLNEAFKLANHFQIAIEEIASVKSDAVIFGRSTFRDQPDDFIIYLKKTKAYLQQVVDTKEKKGWFAAKDIPIFYFFQFPEFGKFKLFFWLKTMRDNQMIEATKFDFNVIPDELLKEAQKVAKLYFQLPSTELWNDDTINTPLRQIQYFYESGWLASKSVGIELCNHLENLIRSIQHQASTGIKYFGDQPVRPEVSFDLYYNDLTVLDNTIYFETDAFQFSMIGYNSLDYLYTYHQGFGNEAKLYFAKQISKSLKLSGAAEKERHKFFNRMYERIDALRATMK